ncbi:hypothetical protein C8F04DRAFT_1259457 [Mycena alexandri]|uniref:Uncharacterized protein n=1 Tax=Mycena alexandri TaxID=1745969 RepID=A0AAD6SWF3_9AGAR|nr:hypothetical protein C8F04DRAFT_1259457 [Mycena alexandri]
MSTAIALTVTDFPTLEVLKAVLGLASTTERCLPSYFCSPILCCYASRLRNLELPMENVFIGLRNTNRHAFPSLCALTLGISSTDGMYIRGDFSAVFTDAPALRGLTLLQCVAPPFAALSWSSKEAFWTSPIV